MDPQKALELFGFLALVEQLDDEDEPEYDDYGRLVKIPSGHLVEYLVTNQGYSGKSYYDYSYTFYGPPMQFQDAEEEQLFWLETTGEPRLYYGGAGEEAPVSVAQTPIRIEDIPEKARFIQ